MCACANWSIYTQIHWPAEGVLLRTAPFSLHFNTVVTGAGPRDNGAPPELAASTPETETEEAIVTLCAGEA